MGVIKRRILLQAGAGLAAAGATTGARAQTSDLAQSGLIGKLEGATVVTDGSAVPNIFSEAPMLAERVKAGTLPPVTQRLPAEPLILKPVHETGRYGGTWRRAFIGPGDSENGNRINASDKLVFWDFTASTIVPCVAKNWQVSDDGRRTTLFLRRGMRWSDGHPFTADDFMFWFEDVYRNKDLVPAAIGEMSVDGKPGRIVSVDDATIAFEFDAPYFLFLEILAGDTLIGGGQSARQSDGLCYGAYAPAHYLRQFLPKYSSVEAVDRLAKGSGFQSWAEVFRARCDWRLNRELPTLGPWHMVQPINGPVWLLERNPYYYAVDTEGHQLPYIDRVQLNLVETPDAVNLRALAGEFDYQERFIDLSKLPVLLENQERGNYKVHLDLGKCGADSNLMFNQTFKGDPEIARLLRLADFRRALSLAIDRDQLNETFWLGLGQPGSSMPADTVAESPGGEWRTRWSTFEPAKAVAMLDALGLSEKGADGMRLRTDRPETLRIEILVAQTLFPTWPKQAEMVAQQWAKVGIAADVKVVERSLAVIRTRNDQDQIFLWDNMGTENLFLYARYVLPVDPTGGMYSEDYALWFATGGDRGTKPDDPELLRAYALLRSAAGKQTAERNRIAQDVWRIAVDQQYAIGIVGQSPADMGVRLVNNRLRNIPDRIPIDQIFRIPGGARPEQWYFSDV